MHMKTPTHTCTYTYGHARTHERTHTHTQHTHNTHTYTTHMHTHRIILLAIILYYITTWLPCNNFQRVPPLVLSPIRHSHTYVGTRTYKHTYCEKFKETIMKEEHIPVASTHFQSCHWTDKGSCVSACISFPLLLVTLVSGQAYLSHILTL